MTGLVFLFFFNIRELIGISLNGCLKNCKAVGAAVGFKTVVRSAFVMSLG